MLNNQCFVVNYEFRRAVRGNCAKNPRPKRCELPDLIFEDSRLVSIYDGFDGERVDLENCFSLAREFRAHSVLDIGCGTGCFASILAANGFDVTAVDPAKASLDYARKKPHAEKVRWILGDATTLPPLAADFAVMTGNVAQVFTSDDSWANTLAGVKRALNKKGHFVFEARDPGKKAWLNWTRDKTYQKISFPNFGDVECWCDVTAVANDLVSFRWTYVFEFDGATISSDSTLRFRDRKAIESSLRAEGFLVEDVRDAPDRPGQELVFIASLK